MKRCLSLILLAGCGSSSPSPAAPKPVASDAATNEQIAAQAQADVDRATAEMARANEIARADGVIVTTATTSPPTCCTTFVKRESLGTFGEVQIWKGPSEQTTKYVVVFGSGSTWRLAEPIDYIEGGDCGVGHCVDRKLDSVVIAHDVSNPVRDGLRVTFHVTEDHYLTEGHSKHDEASAHDVIVDCTLGATPTCTDGR